MDPLIPIWICIAGLFFMAWWIKRGFSQMFDGHKQDPSISLLQNEVQSTTQQITQQMDQLRTSLQQINAQIIQSMDTSQKSMGERLDGASQAMNDVNKHLGQLDISAKRILEVGQDMSSLQNTLQSPKFRGSISELFLKDLLDQILPPAHYKMQYGFKGGQIVDAVILLKAGMVPVDAKFPLENFKKVLDVKDDPSRKAARKLFIKDIKVHIDAIATKYIRTDEGTFDFALMYIPAENVYYESIIKDQDTDSALPLFNYSLAKRVIPVSPNSFYAYLQTVLLGLKGLRVEEGAREVLDNLSRLDKEFKKFNETFRLVGTHLENSMKKYSEAEKRLGRVEVKMEQIDGIIHGGHEEESDTSDRVPEIIEPA